MKIKYIFSTILIALSVCFLASCSGDDENNGSGTTTDSTSTRTLVIEVASVDTRVGLSDASNPRFEWDGTAQTVQLLFVSTSGATATSTATLNIPAGYTSTSGQKITMTITVPTSFASETGYQVAGAFGIGSLSSDGTCTINETSTITDTDYEIPFYFPLTTIETRNGTDYISVAFKRYGSLIRVALTPSTSTLSSATFTSIGLTTPGLFSTAGSFNIKTTGTPEYTASDSYVVDKTYSITSGVAATSSAPQYVYIWIKANTDASTTDELTYTLEADDDNTTAGKWTYGNIRSTALADGNSYTVTPVYTTGDLIISEVVFISTTIGGFVEVYNPTSRYINLSDYTLYDARSGVTMYLGGSSSSFNLISATATPNSANTGVTTFNRDTTELGVQPSLIGPGEVMVFSSYTVPTVSEASESGNIYYEWRGFAKATSYSYYADATNKSFMNQSLLANNIQLNFLGSVSDMGEKSGVNVYSYARKVDYNTPQTTRVSNEWSGFTLSVAGVGGSLGSRALPGT